MNIVVMVKSVPDSEARIRVKPDDGGIHIEDKYELNYFDELAVEAALRLKETVGDGSVVAVTCGGKRALEAVRKAVAMGADGAVHAEWAGEESGDGLRTARVLAICIRSAPFDLVLCGRKATDDDASQVGPMVAEFLGIPHVSAAVDIEIRDDPGTLIVTREDERGKERLACPLPALITAQKGLNEPRVPTIQGVMRGMKLQAQRKDPGELGVGEDREAGHWRVVGFSEPAQKPPVKIIHGPDPVTKARELLRIMRDEIRVIP